MPFNKNKKLSNTEKEMASAVDEFSQFNPEKSAKVADRILQGSSNMPIFIFGKGSSMLFPGTHAKRRAYELTHERRVEIINPENFNVNCLPKNAFVFLCSNSGKTGEILELAEQLSNKKFQYYGITAQPDSELARICQDNVYLLHQPFEKGVAATKSVIEQALFYDALFHFLDKKYFPLGIDGELTKEIAGNMKKNLEAQLSYVSNYVADSDTFYWVDKERGVAEELALKTNEIAGKRSVYKPGTEILHGPGEAIRQLNALRFYNQTIETI